MHLNIISSVSILFSFLLLLLLLGIFLAQTTSFGRIRSSYHVNIVPFASSLLKLIKTQTHRHLYHRRLRPYLFAFLVCLRIFTRMCSCRRRLVCRCLLCCLACQLRCLDHRGAQRPRTTSARASPSTTHITITTPYSFH